MNAQIITLTTPTVLSWIELRLVLKKFFEKECCFFGRGMHSFTFYQEAEKVWKLPCPGRGEYAKIKTYRCIPKTNIIIT